MKYHFIPIKLAKKKKKIPHKQTVSNIPNFCLNVVKEFFSITWERNLTSLGIVEICVSYDPALPWTCVYCGGRNSPACAQEHCTRVYIAPFMYVSVCR